MKSKEKFSQEKARRMLLIYFVPMVFTGSMIIVLITNQAPDYRWRIIGSGALILCVAAYFLGKFINRKAKE